MEFYGLWGSLFVLHEEVINQVEAACRNFLWSGAESYARRPFVAWSQTYFRENKGEIERRTWKYGI